MSLYNEHRLASFLPLCWFILLGFSCLSALQAPTAGPQAEQDGTGNWRGMLKKGGEAPGSGPGSPLKGAVNLLDVVTNQMLSITNPKGLLLSNYLNCFVCFCLLACASSQEAVITWAAGLWGHWTSHQVLLPNCPQEHPRQVQTLKKYHFL